MSSLRAIVIWQKYFGNHVISSQIHLFAPLLNMRRCTLCFIQRLYVYCVPYVVSVSDLCKTWYGYTILMCHRNVLYGSCFTHLRDNLVTVYMYVPLKCFIFIEFHSRKNPGRIQCIWMYHKNILSLSSFTRIKHSSYTVHMDVLSPHFFFSLSSFTRVKLSLIKVCWMRRRNASFFTHEKDIFVTCNRTDSKISCSWLGDRWDIYTVHLHLQSYD